MDRNDIARRNVESGFVFATSRSSGPGGQNVNKVSSKVELRYNIRMSEMFTEEEKRLISEKLKNKINSEGELILVTQSERTQIMNRKAVIEKFYKIVSEALTVNPKRSKTKPTNASRMRRLNDKRIHGIIKRIRKNSGSTDE